MTKKKQDPLKFKDSDGDGLSDYDEINIYGSDPHNADSDGDGISDGEAVAQRRHPVTGAKLKNFIIPNPGNNYQAKSLEPKRLLLHALSALVIKAMIFVLVFFYPITAWMTPNISASEGQKIISLTNAIRQRLELSNLSESPRLNQAAAKKIEDMFIEQYFAHLSPRSHDLEYFLKLAGYNNYIVVGENLAMGYDNAEELMEAWKNSPTHYNNIVDPNFSEIGVALAAGSYLDKDTIFGSQYFALPKTSTAPLKPQAEVIKPVVDVVYAPGEKAVLADKTEVVVVSEAKITIDKPQGAKNDRVVKVEASLPASTTAASLAVLNNTINMTPEEIVSDDEEGLNRWSGQAVIQSDNRSVTPPIISLSTESGEVMRAEVSDNNITPQETSITSQYLLFKNHPDNNLAKIFDISSIYFKVAFGLVLLSLIASVFVDLRKQKLKSLLSGLGFILFLLLMIIF